VNNDKQPEITQRHASHAYETFDKFTKRHSGNGHDVRLLLDPNGNSYSILSVTCDPPFEDVMATRH
jgi:hypothetical protein